MRPGPSGLVPRQAKAFDLDNRFPAKLLHPSSRAIDTEISIVHSSLANLASPNTKGRVCDAADCLRVLVGLTRAPRLVLPDLRVSFMQGGSRSWLARGLRAVRSLVVVLA